MADMPDILKRICAVKAEEIDRLRESGMDEVARRLRAQAPPRGFRAALAASDGVALITELKKASPSAGVIREEFHPAQIARQYEQGGARCLSVLTDGPFFQGSLDHLAEARAAVSLPVLRKDFILHEAQVLQTRAWGADCVLLIVAALDSALLATLLAKARALGMDALVEVHDARELEVALSVGADLIGINNRNLRTFEVSLDTTRRLAPAVPEGTLVVAESGIKTPQDVASLKSCGVGAILVGETLMCAADIVGATRALSDV